MSEPSPIRFSDADLDLALRALAGRVGVEPADRLANAVVYRVRSANVAQRQRRRWWSWSSWRSSPSGVRRLRPAWVVIAIVAVVVVSTLAASPRARAAVSDWLGFGGVQISTRPQDSVPLPAVPVPALSGAGAPVSLAEAGRLVGFRVVVPRLAPLTPLTGPGAVYVGHPPPSGEVLLVYPPGPQLPPTSLPGIGLILAEFHGQVDGEFFAKVLPPGSRLEAVTVGGHPGYWIEGQLHEFFYRNADGSIDQATTRLAGNTLLWTVGGLTLRLESALGKQQALNIASSVS